ncbi:MAG: hypothetical protein HKO02_11215 [Hyphomonadaceae bacterium]|nr:hypothetical protein [Hyphomonadaceae bacterium]
MSSYQSDHIKTAASEMKMGEVAHHDHGAQVEKQNNNDHPCAHCEQGIESAIQSTIIVAIFAPTHDVEILKFQARKHIAGITFTPPPETTERHRWLDPPPPKITTPITLKNRLLT